VVEYAERGLSDPDIAKYLQNLARPMLGHWRGFVRLLVPTLAGAGDAAFVRLHDLLDGKPRGTPQRGTSGRTRWRLQSIGDFGG
jgi:hypothetical protein